MTRLDRFARSSLHLCQTVETLKEKCVDLKVLDQSINTADATGRLLFNMLDAIGPYETEIRTERQMEGIHKAKQRGVAFGRQNKLSSAEVQQLKEQRGLGVLIKDLMKEYELSKASLYRYLGNTKAGNQCK